MQLNKTGWVLINISEINISVKRVRLHRGKPDLGPAPYSSRGLFFFILFYFIFLLLNYFIIFYLFFLLKKKVEHYKNVNM